ncbi:PadR family transcriptional regulator [Herbiconiux sp. P15]|uniref:PadR family transcriptional regulator n=1 Tax=Herbiconiux liukaitaii TaxID=3342799 RepID=UPI0035B6D57B
MLQAVLELAAQESDAYGFSIARTISGGGAPKALTSHGTLYKVLGRLAESGMLAAHWEAAEVAEAEKRPRRRLYSITGDGVATVEKALIAPPPASTPRSVFTPGLSTITPAHP